jgi:glycosyltransferase involved in cell wall biosynthesis
MRASLIMPACNQGNYLRETIASATASLADAWFDWEIVVVDDGSDDGCCDGVSSARCAVIRNNMPQGATRARHRAMAAAQGDIFVMSDPHCTFPRGAISRLVTLANDTGRILMPLINMEGSKVIAGGGMTISYRGCQLERPSHRRRYPSLFGSIYAFNRICFKRMLGFPRLPGKWGYQEQALTLLAYKNGCRATVDKKYTCTHRKYRRKGSYPYEIGKHDMRDNAFYTHAICLPQTYLKYWNPLLSKNFGTMPWTKDPALEEQKNGVCQLVSRSDDQVLTMVCGDWKSKYKRAMEGK